MPAVDVGVQASAGFEFENLVLFVDRPDTSESGIDVPHQDLGAVLQTLPEARQPGERAPHFCQEGCQAVPFGRRSFRALALRDVDQRALNHLGIAALIGQQFDTGDHPEGTAILASQPHLEVAEATFFFQFFQELRALPLREIEVQDRVRQDLLW